MKTFKLIFSLVLSTIAIAPLYLKTMEQPIQRSNTTLPTSALLDAYNPEERWDWSVIDTSNIFFPKKFKFGTGESAYQVEGDALPDATRKFENSWTAWQEKKNLPSADNACERWTRYEEDVALMAQIGLKAARFSVEWTKVEPERGVFDHEAMQHYIDYMKAMIAHNIQPIPTLFHHAWPLWFGHAYPSDPNPNIAFADERNIQDFVKFALYVLNAVKEAGILDQVPMWLTFNEPVGFAISAYIHGNLPPGSKGDFVTAGNVAKNMLDAHIAIYDAFKKINPELQISFAHIMAPIHPENPSNEKEALVAKVYDYLVNDVGLEYFKTGNFYWLNRENFAGLITEPADKEIFTQRYNPNAIGKLDFVGANYYTHVVIRWDDATNTFKGIGRPDETMADGYPHEVIKPIHAEGFYPILKKAASLGLPVIVTENGFSAKEESIELRGEYLKKHLYVMSKALSEGIDLRGYLFWTFMDCYGWNSGKHSMHGLVTKQRTAKRNAEYLIKVMNTDYEKISK